jgi:hypothetical protein
MARMTLVWGNTTTKTADIDESALIETETDVGCKRIMDGYQQPTWSAEK